MELNRSAIRKTLKGYEARDDRRSQLIFISYLSIFLILLALSVYCYTVRPWLAAIFWIPLWVILCKFFVFLHDCGHFSLFNSRAMNILGGNLTGFFILLPYSMWRKIHDSHHAVTGNLDRREDNPGLSLMTVKEYEEAGAWVRFRYRFMRSIYVRLLLVPLSLFIIGRIPFPKLGRTACLHIILLNAVYAALIYVLISMHWMNALLLVYAIPLYAFYLFSAIMFFLQHQYEETYWAHEGEWDFVAASFQGSSYIKFGPLMSWITGNVGCHHIHHINCNIPYYNLQEATDHVNTFVKMKSIRFLDMFQHLSFVLWDESRSKIVPFNAYKK